MLWDTRHSILLTNFLMYTHRKVGVFEAEVPAIDCAAIAAASPVADYRRVALLLLLLMVGWFESRPSLAFSLAC